MQLQTEDDAAIRLKEGGNVLKFSFFRTYAHEECMQDEGWERLKQEKKSLKDLQRLKVTSEVTLRL